MRSRVHPSLLAALVATLVYCNTVCHDFVYDDHAVVQANPAAHDPTDLAKIFLAPSWGGSELVYRPLTIWTFSVQHWLHGERPVGYHLVNVVLHLGASAVLVSLTRGLGGPLRVAAIAGVLFAAHPVHTEAVANVVGRAEMLAALFTFLALYFQRRCRPVWDVATVIAYAAALLSKETAIVVVVLGPLADLLVADQGSLSGFWRELRGRRAYLYSGIAAVTVAYFLLRRRAAGAVLGDSAAIAFWANPLVSASAYVRLLTAFKVAARAVWLLLAPFRLSAEYSYPQIAPAASIADPGTLVGIALAVGFATVAIWLWGRRSRLVLWAVLSFAAYAIVSNVCFPIGTIFAERLLYLPSAGACVFFAAAMHRSFRADRALTAAAAVVVLVWGGAAAQRNLVWRDDLTFGRALVDGAPGSAHAHQVYGSTLAVAGRLDEAWAEFEEALRIDPRYVGSLYNSALVLRDTGRPIDAVTRLRRVIEIEPRHYRAWMALAELQLDLGESETALAAANQADAIAPGTPAAALMKASALRRLGRFDEALATLDHVLRTDPTNVEALAGVGGAAVDAEKYDVAVSALERLVTVAPTQGAYGALITAYRRAGRPHDADREAASADAWFRQTYPGLASGSRPFTRTDP